MHVTPPVTLDLPAHCSNGFISYGLGKAKIAVTVIITNSISVVIAKRIIVRAFPNCVEKHV